MSCLEVIRHHPYSPSMRSSTESCQINNFKSINNLCKPSSYNNLKSSLDTNWKMSRGLAPLKSCDKNIENSRFISRCPGQESVTNTDCERLSGQENSKYFNSCTRLVSCTASNNNESGGEARYVVYQYFEGDTKDEVDNHFSKALDQTSNSQGK